MTPYKHNRNRPSFSSFYTIPQRLGHQRLVFHRLQSPWHFTTPKLQILGLHHYIDSSPGDCRQDADHPAHRGEYLHQIYNLLEIDLELVNARVTAANWYWSRRNMIKLLEVDDLPVIIEVRREPGGG